MPELETMKLHFAFVVTALTVLNLHRSWAQNIYGFQQNVIPWQQGLYLAGYDVLGDTWVWGDTLDYAEGFGLGSSTYDQWEDNFVFLGLPSGGMTGLQWMAQPVWMHNGASFAEFEGTLHSIHHDMQSGQFYGLQGYGLDSTWVSWGDDDGYWQINNWATRVMALTPEDGEVGAEVVLALPWLEGVVAGASCYDSDTHRFFIWGIDNTGQGRLVGVDCALGEVVSDVSPALEANQNLSEFEYNIVDGMLLGLRASLNSTNTSAVMELISVDPATGEITPRLELPNLDSYTPDGTVFDQLNRMYVLHYYAGLGTSPHIMAIDATTWDILADNPLNQNFLELEMSNVAFADQRYSLSDVSGARPASMPPRLEQGRWTNLTNDALAVTRMDQLGRVVEQSFLPPHGALEVPSGFWMWTFQGQHGQVTRKTLRR